RKGEFLEDDPAPCPGSLESAEASAQETTPDEEATLEGDASPSCADVVEPEPIAMIESVSEPESEALFIPEMPDACLPEPEPESEPVAEREPPEEEIPASEPVPVAAIEPEAVILPEIPEEEIAEPEPVAVIEPEPELEPEPIAVIQPVPEPEPVAELPPIPLTMHCAEEVRLEPGQTVKITREMVEVRGPVESSQRELLLLIAPALGSLLRLNEPLEAGDRFSQDDIDNDRIRYRHEGNDPGQDSFTLATPGGETEEATLHLTIRRRHRAPELVGPGQLVRVQEGCPVEDVLQDAVRRSSTEVDPGLAVLSIQGRGDWDYLLPKSKEWLPLSEVGPSRALLLGPATLIRFTPRAGWTGRIQLQFRAWDRSSGAEGECVDLSARWAFGGTTAFSAEAGNVTASVTSRFPRLNVVEPWVEELTAEDLIGEGMAVVRAEGMGVWQFSLDGGRSWQDIGPVYHGRARLIREHDRVRFLPRKGGSGKVTLIARPWDGTGPDAGDVTNLAGHHAFGQGTPFGESLQTRSWRLDGE
ncbi:MAG: cadherin-like domain-containing protein, partial [Gemmataceae bacterium]